MTEWLSKMGWTLQSADDLKPYNRLQMNAVIEPILVEKVMGLNGVVTKQYVQWVKSLVVRYKQGSDKGCCQGEHRTVEIYPQPGGEIFHKLWKN